MKESSDGETNGGRHMVPDLVSSRGESTTSKIGFSPGNVQERLTRGTERTTGLMVGYEIMKVSSLLSVVVGLLTSIRLAKDGIMAVC